MNFRISPLFSWIGDTIASKKSSSSSMTASPGNRSDKPVKSRISVVMMTARMRSPWARRICPATPMFRGVLRRAPRVKQRRLQLRRMWDFEARGFSNVADGRFRRILVITGRSGEGPLTEPTAVAHPWQREPLAFAGHHHRVLLSPRPTPWPAA
jgi:hypothetical protein